MAQEVLRIGVLGAGAMGSFFGGRLKSGGAVVT
jgi:ketopantoate reductase